VVVKGDHVCVDRVLYVHHGLWLGGDRVVHYSGEPGDVKNAEIAIVTVADFLKGGRLRALVYPSPFEADEIVARAMSRLGERRYSLLVNNCEHFVSWCRLGVPRSLQVEEGVEAFTGFLKKIIRPKE
jgi:hypothetical protein